MDEHQDREKIIESLRALSTGRNRSVTARVREIFDEIESALQAGVRIKDVHKVLADNGFGGTLRAFEVAIHRIRKARAVSNTKSAKSPIPSALRSIPTPPSTSTPTKDEKDLLADGSLNRHKAKALQYAPDDDANPLLKH